MPEMKAVGTKTAQSTRAMATSAMPTSSMVRRAASRGVAPCARCRSTFSTTTMASSTTMPMARISPNIDSVFSDRPSAAMAAKVPMMETGIARSGISAARQDCRNSTTTTTTSSTASPKVCTTASIDCSKKRVVS